MELLYWFESIRNPVCDFLMSAITVLGGELTFIAAAVILFWCVNKKDGYYMLSVGLLGTVINQFLKLWFRIPRPWVKDPEFTIVESARAEATGYSFPSGHTQNAFAVMGVPGMTAKTKGFKILFFVLLVLIPISRMYLGVHTPLDVGVSFIIGSILLFGLYPVFRDAEEKPLKVYIVLSASVILNLAFVIFTELYKFPADVDIVNLAHGAKNAYTLLGAGLGLLLCFHLDRKYINFETKATLWAQILKSILGLLGVMAVRSILKAPLSALFGGHLAANAVRYFFMVMFAGCIWPLTFKYFARLRPLSEIFHKEN